jgi:hypothetical protein
VKTTELFVAFEFLTAVVVKNPVFWDTMPCNPLKFNDVSVCYLLRAGFLLGLYFGPEHGGDIFLRNVD